jgi:hypothetical protein
MDGSETLLNPLNRHVTKILRLPADGLSNHRILRKLFITQGTVSDTSNIFKVDSKSDRTIFGLILPFRNRSQVIFMERAGKVWLS